MGTKIYNGFVLKISDIFEFHDKLMRWRDDLKKMHREDLARTMARMIADMIDRETLRPGEFAGKSPWSQTFWSIIERQKKVRAERTRDTEVDFEFELSFFPFEGRLFGNVYCERPEWREAWMNLDFVEDFSYWDGSEGPKTVTAEEWTERERVWDGIFQTESVPAMAGFHAQCTYETSLIYPDEVLAFMPTFEERVISKAKDVAHSKRFHATLGGDGETTTGHLDWGKLIAAMDWLRTEEGQAAVEVEAEKMRTLLIPEITKEVIIGDLAAASPKAPPEG